MIDLNNLDNFFITSDTWFGRSNILDIGKRIKFKSIEDMNSSLIKNWNSKVKNNDVVFHLGNFVWDPITAHEVIPQLNGKIYTILSNDDGPITEVFTQYENLDILDNQIIVMPSHDLVMSHYPLSMWPGQDTGTLHIHGHAIYSHPTDLMKENRVNVCIDNWNYSPINISTIKEFKNEKND